MINDKKTAYECAKILLDTKSIQINTQNPFTYVSGKIGPTYCDMRRLISFPTQRSTIMAHAQKVVSSLGVNYLAGGETAGIPYAAFLAERLNLPMIYIRKKPKGHGKMAQIEGYIDENNAQNNILLIEDLITVGSSQKVFVDALRDANIKIDKSFTIFSYDIYPNTEKNLKDMNIQCYSLTNWWSILEVVKAENYLDSKTISSLEEFLNAPEDWATNFTKRVS